MSVTAAAEKILQDHGLDQPVNFRASMDALLQSVQLDGDVGLPSPSALAQGWRNFLDLDSSSFVRDSLERACLIGALYQLTSKPSPSLREAFSVNRLSLSRSRTEMAMRLGSRLFMIGRKGKVNHGADENGKLLRASIHYFDRAAEAEASLRPNQLRILYGMRGVARLMVARGISVTDDLRKAAEDLDRSHNLGDISPQNLKYRREAALRTYDSSRDLALLDRLAALFEEPCHRDRQYYSDQALYYQFRILNALDRKLDPTGDLVQGLLACENGLKAPPDVNTADAVFLNLRGFLRFLDTQARFLVDRTGSQESLDLAIIDFRAARLAGFGGASLPQALLYRSNASKLTDLPRAKDDLNEALSCLDLADAALAERLERQIRASLADYSVRAAQQANDIAALLPACQELLAFGDAANRYAFTLVHALRVLWKEPNARDPPSALTDVSETVLKLASDQVDAALPEDESAARLLSYLGSLSRRLDAGVPSQRTLEFYRLAIERPSDKYPDLFSQAADAALHFGKRRSSEGASEEAASLFEDAVRWYDDALRAYDLDPAAASTSFLPVVCHSKLGEALLRQRSGTLGTRALMTRAIEHLGAALRLGNEAPEIFGLLGDAHYRRGFFDADKAELRTALEFKLRAQIGGHLSRENRSVVARIHHRLFVLTGGDLDFAKAIEAALQAHLQSEMWPWPLFQMAEFASVARPSRSTAVAQLPDDIRRHKYVAWIEDGARDRLLNAAVHLAVASKEFRRLIIGGRTQVFVLEDPHRLLSATMVLKPTDAAKAKFEVDTTKQFGEHIEALRLSHKFSLPTPIAIIPGDEKGVVYAMERERADTLAQRLRGVDDLGYHGESELTTALDFLAVFHAWRNIRPSKLRAHGRLTAKFGGYLEELGLSGVRINQALEDFRGTLPSTLPLVQKKDAHPENWLVSGRGRVVMIDLESTSWEPILLDVAQLLDDYPALAPNADGWAARLTLCDRYWRRVAQLEPDPMQIDKAYSALAIFRCAFGLSFCRREVSKRRASSALHVLGLRISHYSTLLAFLEGRSRFPAVRRMAGHVRLAVQP